MSTPLPLPEGPSPWWARLLTRLLTDDRMLCRLTFLIAVAAVCGVRVPVAPAAKAAVSAALAAALEEAAAPTPTPPSSVVDGSISP